MAAFRTATFCHAKYDCLASAPRPDFATGTMAADVSLIHFDVAAKDIKTIGLDHELADLLAHAPRGFVGHAERAL